MSMRETVQFPSRTGEGVIQARIYWPDDMASASDLLVQIVHGMAEHMERYDAFCRYLTGQGIAVCIHDLPGHGQSAPSADKLGFFGAEEGYRKVPGDIDELAKLALARLAVIPGGQKRWRRVLFGHSMGSLISRCYMAQPGLKLAGAILSSTAGSQPMKLIPGILLARRSVRRNGPLFKDEFLAKLTGAGFLKRIPQPRTPVDWLTRDQTIVDAYIADPLCGFTFTAAGYLDLCGWVKTVSSKAWAAQVPADLPILLFAGDEDPVSDYGRGTRQVSGWLADTGHTVKMKSYPGCRHETLNELNRDEIWADVVQWLQDLPVAKQAEKGCQ